MLANNLFQRMLSRSSTSAGSLASYRPLLAEVHRHWGVFRAASAGELPSRLSDLRDQIAITRRQGTAAVLPSLLALAAESLRRTLGVELYDVQLAAGAALCRGCVTEMRTGEGKTFTVLLPACWYALTGEGVHVVTSNSYLAERDQELLRPAYELLGLKVALLPEQGGVGEKKNAYQADVTYGTGYEFGFDYLRDQLSGATMANAPAGQGYLRRLRSIDGQSEQMQRGLVHAIVDEVDHVLLDDACSPLVIAAGDSSLAVDAAAHQLAWKLSGELAAEVEYRLEVETSQTLLTPAGLERIHASDLGVPMSVLQRPWAEYVRQALQARFSLRRDADYVVHDEEVRIVDRSTGRIFEDRNWQDGLHQAIEAKEGLPVKAERRPLADITRQRYFRQYRQLCGLTGTARGAEAEFQSVYRLPVEVIPPHRPSQLRMLPPRYFTTSAAVWKAVTSRAAALTAQGRPVLIGTPSIGASERLADELAQQRLTCQVLNGRQDAVEADIVAQAGEPGRITVATNLAGRGTDIKLPAESAAVGGLHVIACGRHRARRIDRQMIGRCARQGAPGSAEVLVSAEDALIADAAPWLRNRFLQRSRADGLVAEDWTGTLDRLQRRAERHDATMRRNLLELDAHRESVLSELEGLRT